MKKVSCNVEEAFVKYGVVLVTKPFLMIWIKYGFTTAQEVLESLKDRWFQADNPPADQLLNEEEFLSFLHPEHSRGMLRYMVKEIVRDLGNLKFMPKKC